MKYLGPALRTFTYRRRDHRRARAKLGLAGDAIVITVLPGSWTAAMDPAYEAIATAFDRLAGADEHLLKLRVSDRLDITILGADWQV